MTSKNGQRTAIVIVVGSDFCREETIVLSDVKWSVLFDLIMTCGRRMEAAKQAVALADGASGTIVRRLA